MVLSIASVIQLTLVERVYDVPGLEVNTDRFDIRKISRLLRFHIIINKRSCV
jgi:hypothetical protein